MKQSTVSGEIYIMNLKGQILNDATGVLHVESITTRLVEEENSPA